MALTGPPPGVDSSAIAVPGGKLKISNVPIGAVALASMGTNTTDVIQLWVTDIYIPCNRQITTIGMLQGGTATTDKVIYCVYSAAGVLLASTPLAGLVLNSTPNTFLEQQITLNGAGQAISALQLYGPGQYYIAVQGNGTTGGALQTVPAPYLDICAGSVVAGSFGTLPTPITVPTTFTAAKAPIVYVY
jgi:hypothetical protein